MEFINELFGQPPLEWFKSQVQNNHMFVAIFGSMLLGSLLYTLRSIPKKIWNLFVLKCTVVLEVHNDTVSYSDLMAFMNAKGLIGERTRKLSLDKEVECSMTQMEDDSAFFSQSRTNNNTNTVTLGSGFHYFTYKGRPFFVWHTIGESKMKQRPKTLTIRTLGVKNTLMKQLLAEASHMQNQQEEDKISVYSYETNYWSLIGRKPKRPLETVIIPREQKSDLLHDIEWMMNNSEWYRQRGIPYRRGYLFFGQPGTGKTSLVYSLASHYSIPIYILNLSTLRGDDQLMDALGDVPNGVFLLMEDIDAAGVNLGPRKESKKDRHPSTIVEVEDDSEKENEDQQNSTSLSMGVTLSGLLNALDGITSPDRVITFMTTNHPDKLEPALIRPGRVDRLIEIGYPGYHEVWDMFWRFFPNEEEWKATTFAEAYNRRERSLSQAELQELCMEYSNDPDGAIQDIETRNTTKQTIKEVS